MILLDTHIWIWWISRSNRLTSDELASLDALSTSGDISIASISLWEMANLVSLKRLTLNRSLDDWLQAATDPMFVKVHRISPKVSAEIAVLPETLHRDPADRLIIATARVLKHPLHTLDQKIIDSGLVEIFKYPAL